MSMYLVLQALKRAITAGQSKTDTPNTLSSLDYMNIIDFTKVPVKVLAVETCIIGGCIGLYLLAESMTTRTNSSPDTNNTANPSDDHTTNIQSDHPLIQLIMTSNANNSENNNSSRMTSQYPAHEEGFRLNQSSSIGDSPYLRSHTAPRIDDDDA